MVVVVTNRIFLMSTYIPILHTITTTYGKSLTPGKGEGVIKVAATGGCPEYDLAFVVLIICSQSALTIRREKAFIHS